ncbi:NAD(P)H-binding protein [Actinocrispum wychmicini]|uniref:Uncharacterized protein YbjT (DUF2867 family) n=1 Tax=Actinocrispum wychmicini TaxID=1213861 RepID=A0A4R2JF29_9PSEU|nr:NAD(P)H-binding protein [Actinocrispum wychmicini]TCO52835.1 uncharacterized protein YbjT (DUF2867 family) [Actinocrispum wychmicini]
MTTLVLGATGKTGRRVAARLRDRGVGVRASSRSSTAALPSTAAFDWDDESTWPAAVAGVDGVYLVYYPELAFPGVAEKIEAFAEMAVQAGVRRLVLLGGRGVELLAGPSERAVQNSGAEWTILRCSWFSQNFSEGFLLEPTRSGEIELPAGDTPEPFLDADDIAAVAVAALTEDGHNEQIYELSGPRAMTFDDAAEEIAKAANRDIKYVPITFVDYGKLLRAQGLPRALLEVFRTILDGRNAEPTDGVQRALRREAREFSEYAQKAAATGVWNA